MIKSIIALVCIGLLMVGCSSNSKNESFGKKESSQIMNVETSHFDKYTSEQTNTAYVVKGRVNQENDENAVVIMIHAEENATVSIQGTLTKNSGGDTALTYVSPDGEKTKIADNSSEILDTTIKILKGDGKVIFIGESAVYDFEIHFEMTDGVSFSDL
ncbi:MAG: hypothetical protein PHE02_13525 [Lachnospiraceae bacterium]|nr:hypothetical protein [Lachnospiraceae bacterium]